MTRPPPVTVRPATVDDAAAIAHVHVLGWQQAYRGLMPDDFLDAIDVARRADSRRAMLEGPPPGSFTLVADHRATGIVGFVMGYPFRRDEEDPPAPEGNVGEIAAIYVLADHYDTGAGGALMEAALAHLEADGHTRASLWVLEGNARACRFYERGGWAHDGVRKQAAFGGATVTELRYVREAPFTPPQRPQ